MSDLTQLLPQKTATVAAIEAYWKQRGDSEPERGYLGASSIGHHCERYLWYSFRQCCKPDFDGRMYRLFNRGHREEAVFTEELRAIGCEVHDVNPETGGQFEVTAVNGHFKGHSDGVALGVPEAPKTWHLLEEKTSNTKGFEQIKKHGVEKAQPKHYAQMQLYMHLMKLDRALYLVVNKETDELYSERVNRIPEQGKALVDRAERIIEANAPPERCADRPDSWLCKFCDAHKLCWGQGGSLVPVPKLSCRQCCHATPIEDGKWKCDKGHEFGAPCRDHLMLPGLVHGYEPANAHKLPDGSDVIEFEDRENKRVFFHGPSVVRNSREDTYEFGCFSSNYLITLPKGFISLPWAEPIRGDGMIQVNLLERYSSDTCTRKWIGKPEELPGEWERLYGGPMPEPQVTAKTDKWSGAEFDGGRCALVFAEGNAEIREDSNVPF